MAAGGEAQVDAVQRPLDAIQLLPCPLQVPVEFIQLLILLHVPLAVFPLGGLTCFNPAPPHGGLSPLSAQNWP